MGVAPLTGQAAGIDPLAPALLVARIVQSPIHRGSLKAAAVTLQFTAIGVEMAIAALWGWEPVAA